MELMDMTVAQALGEFEEQNFDPEDFGYGETGLVTTVDLYRVRTEGDETVVNLTASCSEALWFHREQYPELFEPEVEGEDPELTVEAYDAAVKILWDRYDAEVYEETDGYLRFNVSTTVTDENLTLEEVDKQIDSRIRKLYNELDPGTFNCEYTFGIIARELKK